MARLLALTTSGSEERGSLSRAHDRRTHRSPWQLGLREIVHLGDPVSIPSHDGRLGPGAPGEGWQLSAPLRLASSLTQRAIARFQIMRLISGYRHHSPKAGWTG